MAEDATAFSSRGYQLWLNFAMLNMDELDRRAEVLTDIEGHGAGVPVSAG